MKKLLSTIVLILLAGYIVFATIAFCNKPADQVCKGIRLEMRDSLKTGYMTTTDVVSLLKQKGLDPTGRLLDEVSCRAIEKVLDEVPLIAQSECYKTIGGYVGVEVKCRRPILHVIANNGENYYIDEEGEVIEKISKAVYLPVATGYITREFAKDELFALACYLQANDFWNAQIGQVHVTARKEIELVPRVGDHIIVLGRPNDYTGKFEKLYTFYEEGLGVLGWNKYSRINLDYSDQVIGTRK